MVDGADTALVNELENKAHKIRKDLINFIYRIGMGHLGGELSMLDVAVALYYKYMNYDPKNPKMPERDRLILSKGHCGETLYTIFADMGMYTIDYIVEHFETLNTAKFGMHPNRKYIDSIEASTGSLGHGLSIAVGLAIGARMQKAKWRTFCIVGDGEIQEGSNWEAIMAAAQFKLGNLVAIIDKNRFQMSGETKETMNIDPLDEKFRAFGWDVVEMQGNNMKDVVKTFDKLPISTYEARKPLCIIAHTTKGYGVDFMEDTWKWHGGGIAKEQRDQALESIDRMRMVL
jgi:Transketolase, N-terminal subunit